MSEYSPSRWWRLKGQFLRLEGTNCPDCRLRHFPPRPICPEPDCPSREKVITENRGEIFHAGSESIEATSS